MEKLKNDEKAKHANRPDYYSQGCAFTIIGLMFLLLTLVTSYKTLSVLPHPTVFFYASWRMCILLLGFLHVIGLAWRDFPIPLSRQYVIVAFLLSTACFLWWVIYLSTSDAGSWRLGIFHLTGFNNIPVVLFPLLLMATCCTAILCVLKSIIVPRLSMKIMAYAVMLFAAIYTLGHAGEFEEQHYDEGLTINDISYYSVYEHYWLGLGSIHLYECQYGFWGCKQIHETAKGIYSVRETQFVYDAENQVLRLDYHMLEYQHRDIPPILYEYPVR